jgi:hypothetical protein
MYLVNLVSVPQDPDAALTNKVLPEQEGSPLARVLLLAARNREEGQEDDGRFLSGDYSVPFPAELVTVRNCFYFFFSMARQPLGGLCLLIFLGFAITHFRHTTLGRTSLDE